LSLLRRAQAAKERKAEAAAAALPAEERFKPARIARLTAESQNRNARFESEHGADAVRNSADLERILALPRRPIPDEDALERMRLEMTARLTNGRAKADGCRCHELNPARFDGTPGSACITELWKIQAWDLYEAETVQGVLGAISVGSGKTGIDILTAMVVPGCREAVLLIPPNLHEQFLRDYKLWAQHFKVPNISGGPGASPDGRFVAGRPVLHVLKYSELSSKNFATWFADRPDISVVVADEVQALKDRSAIRVRRFLNHFATHPETRFFCHTGSLTSKGLEDYSHLSALALGEASPVPIEPHVVTAWGRALNPPRHGDPAPPGALLRLCEPGETVHQGFARRFLETPGVVATFEGSLTGVTLTIKERKPPPMPEKVREKLHEVRTKKIRPDGELLTDALEVAKTAREVACGFYLYWNFPGAKPEDFEEPNGKIPVWFKHRQAWNREVRDELTTYKQGLDSEGLLKDAARRALAGYEGDKPVWHSETWEAWAALEKTVPHETRTAWLDDWLARDAAAWALEQERIGRPGIVWVLNPSMGHLIAKLAGRPYYGQGKEAEIAIGIERGDRSIVASIGSHHKGRNLQAFNANLVTQPPSAADIWEQLIGRTHRSLQRAREVTVEVYLHTPELADGFAVAMGRAKYANGTIRADQKLLSSALADSIGIG
jgi:hypothetical protein